MISILKILLIPICFFGWFKDSRSIEEKNFDRVMKEGISYIEKKYKLETMGIGGGIPKGLVENFNISFQHKGILDIDELRALILNIAKDFLAIVNSDEKIRPFLAKYPFTDEGLSLRIFVHDKNGYELEHPFFSISCLCGSEIRYETLKKLSSSPYPKTITRKTESYNEAVKILQEQQNLN
ncbi:hypothetical protein BN1013_00739 [Candidatus Rubidus massiliensis]|nr:MAG: hypothetical protein BGO10_09785 [Chlamydia sp. 32-24]CDZ80232.1 hypothetical protein BN1013_00739 [Candidatus Rubidus massiliensis]